MSRTVLSRSPYLEPQVELVFCHCFTTLIVQQADVQGQRITKYLFVECVFREYKGVIGRCCSPVRLLGCGWIALVFLYATLSGKAKTSDNTCKGEPIAA